uniref:Mediator of RNA polymerase II transcription subunit 1 n=1 Tax=Stegastes partitus TaxID=144197 RepID=A0A3B5AGU6_9TELE
FYFSSSRSSLCLMKKKAVMSTLHVKFAEKTWNETFQLIRRCMEKSRDESKPCEPLVRSLERLQEEFDVSSMNVMRSHLPFIVFCYGAALMGFHFTEAACYLTADLFYLEVLLLPGGGVEEVKVAPHGRLPAVSGLKALVFKETTDIEAIQAAQVTVGTSSVSHWLQMASVIWQLDFQGYHPVFAPMSEVPNETLPACFLLRLQPEIPMRLSFVQKLSQITDVDLLLIMLLTNRFLRVQPLPGGLMHSYVLPGAAWDAPTHRGIVVDSVAFTHPAHVPALLDVLRHQCAINTLLRSCFSVRGAGPGRRSLTPQNHSPCGDDLSCQVCSKHLIYCWLRNTRLINPIRFGLRSVLRSPSGVRHQLFCDLPPTQHRLPDCL